MTMRREPKIRHEPGVWFKSSYTPDKSDCVEVNLGAEVGVRDTKNRSGGRLAVSSDAWQSLLDRVMQD